MTNPSPAPDRFLRRRDVLSRIGVGTTTLYSLIKQKRLAPPIHLGSRTSVWRESDINAFIENETAKAAASRAGLGGDAA